MLASRSDKQNPKQSSRNDKSPLFMMYGLFDLDFIAYAGNV